MSTKAESTYSRRADADLLAGALKALPPLTDKQAGCLKFVTDYFLQWRYYPTQREVAQAMNIKSTSAETYLGPLVRMGYLKRKPRSRRNIELTPAAIEKLELMGINIRKQLLAA